MMDKMKKKKMGMGKSMMSDDDFMAKKTKSYKSKKKKSYMKDMY